MSASENRESSADPREPVRQALYRNGLEIYGADQSADVATLVDYMAKRTNWSPEVDEAAARLLATREVRQHGQ